MAIALFDMDGTLFDFEGQMRRDLACIRSPNEPHPTDQSHPQYIQDLWAAEKEYPWLKPRMDLIKRQPGWWRDLETLDLGWNVYHWCTTIGFDNHILTKGPHKIASAWSEKVECVRRHLPINTTIHMSEDKGQVYGRVLVDDYEPYIRAWLAHRKRGLVIMPGHYYNADFQHPNVIRYDGSIGSGVEVKRALEAARKRKPKQHWKELM